MHNCLVSCCQHSCFAVRLVVFTVFVKALLLKSRYFFLSLKQHVSGLCAFDEENGPERLKSKGTNEKNLTVITLKKTQILMIFSFEALTPDFFVLQYRYWGTEKTHCQLCWFPRKLSALGFAFIHSRLCRCTIWLLYSRKIVVKFQLLTSWKLKIVSKEKKKKTNKIYHDKPCSTKALKHELTFMQRNCPFMQRNNPADFSELCCVHTQMILKRK